MKRDKIYISIIAILLFTILISSLNIYKDELLIFVNPSKEIKSSENPLHRKTLSFSDEEKKHIERALNSLTATAYEGIDKKKDYKGLPKISLYFNKEITISSYDFKKYGENYNYSISYGRMGPSNPIKLKYNDTFFIDKLSSSKDIDVSINFEYRKDWNKADRTDGITRGNQDDNLYSFEKVKQEIKFFIWDVTFKEKLNFPKQIIIWNEFSPDTYTCNLLEQDFVHNGMSYSADYDCPVLPNFKDYGGQLDIIFKE